MKIKNKRRNCGPWSRIIAVSQSKFGGMDVNQLKRIKELEAELAQYKKIVAEQTLSITVLKDVLEKKL